jgi:hypothetical protein
LVSDADRLALSRLVAEIIHEGDGGGPAIPSIMGEDTDEFARTEGGWRFVSRAFEVLFG